MPSHISVGRAIRKSLDVFYHLDLSYLHPSEYILAACAKNGVVHVFKLRDEEWNARIDCGAEGLVKAIWAPDGRTILCFSEWGVGSMVLIRACNF